MSEKWRLRDHPLVYGLGILFSGVTFYYTVLPEIFGLSIVTFDVSAEQIVLKDSVSVSWRVEGKASDILLDGERVPPSGERDFQLSRDRTFTLVAKNRWGKVETRSRHVRVVPPPIRIITFDANPKDVKPGGEVKVVWEISGQAESISIEPTIGSAELIGQWTGQIQEETTFTLTAAGRRVETVTAQVNVRVLQTDLEFQFEPNTIHKGEAARLVWKTNADWIEIMPGVGTFHQPAGEKLVFPGETTTFEAVAYGPGGPRRQAATVTVLPPRPPNVRVWVVPRQIVVGQAATIRWEAVNADRVTLEYQGAHREFSPRDQYEINPSREGATEIRLIAAGPGGEDRKSVQVEVLPRPRAKVMILTTEVRGGSGGALAEELAGLVSAHFKANGYDVVLPPNFVRSPEQVLELYRRSRDANFVVPDMTAQVSLTFQSETRKPTKAQIKDFIGTVIGRALTGNRSYTEDRYVEVVVSCVATVQVVGIPQGLVMETAPGEARETRIVDRGQAYVLLNHDSDISRSAALKAVDAALKKVALKP